MTKDTEKKKSGHHDIFFKTGYSDPRFAKDLFQLAFSKEEMAAFDWDGLRAEKDTFEGLRADLVFSVPLKSEPNCRARIFLLLEHKSRWSRWIYYQVLKYKTLIIGKNLKEAEDDCLVIAVVFYHGEEPWKWAKSLKQGLWGRVLPKIPPSLAKDVLDYGIRLIDAHDPKVEQAIRDKNFNSRGFLGFLKRIWFLKAEEKDLKERDLKERDLKETLSLFDNWPGDKEDLALSVGDYLWSAVPGMTKELWEELEREAVSKGIFSKGGYMNIREHIKEEGRQEGIQKGRQEGRQEGIQKGRQEEKQQVILNMLAQKADIAFICKVTGLSEEEIKKLQNGN